ncbi:MAG: hypothetical protein ACYS8W_18970 [Planctomycetota bacterium]|jgi:hypothetical protein
MNPNKRHNIDRLILAAALIAVWALFLPIDRLLEPKHQTFEEMRDSFFLTDFSAMTAEEKSRFFRKFRQQLLMSENYFRRRFERTEEFALAYAFLSRETRNLFVDEMMPTPTRRMLDRLLSLSPDERKLLVDRAFGELPEPRRPRNRVPPEDAKRLKRLLGEKTEDEIRQFFRDYFFQQAQEHENLRLRPLMDEIFKMIRNEAELQSVLRNSARVKEEQQ